jgi:predicted  nucleic acid-binding Zn-ribbon protein
MISPFTEVGREIHELSSRVDSIERKEYSFAKQYELDNVRANLSNLQYKIQQLENTLEEIKSEIRSPQNG